MVLLVTDMLVGVVLKRVAVPPLIVKEKSVESNVPVPSLLLNTASLKVTMILLLSGDGVTDEIVDAF